MFVRGLFLKIQLGDRLATSNFIGSLLRFSTHWIVSVVIVIAIVRKTKPSDPYDYDYDYDALATTLTSTIKHLMTGPEGNRISVFPSAPPREDSRETKLTVSRGISH